MKWFGLDPDSVAARLEASGRQEHVPSLRESILVGGVGFAAVGLAAFGVWAGVGPWLDKHVGELGLYAACAVVLIGGGGGVFGRLVIGPGRLRRFCGLFALGFFLYAGAWTGSFFSLQSQSGEWLGSVLGPAILGMTLVNAFSAPGAVKEVVAVLCLTHSIGYFAGRFLYGAIPPPIGNLFWGAAYGLCFGAGIGFALFVCQEAIRARLRPTAGPTPGSQ